MFLTLYHHLGQAHEQNFTEKPCTFLARIKLEYEMQRV